jgi:glutamyl-tRNA synthetase
MHMQRGRFAPTPSGELHIGNARTALLAWLQMRQAGGAVVLRIEDIDKPRTRPQLASQILADLAWLGLDWDEGPDVGGPYAPYVQSEREALYQGALHRLQAGGWLYPCYCSRAHLMTIASAPHGLATEGPRYPGTCRHLTPQEREAHATRPHSLRFAMREHPITFDDLVLGTQRFDAGAGGDFVVHRADGLFGYQLAVMIDDAAMQITDVLRGADLLDSTPRQIALYDALGLPIPRFAHLPLLYYADGQRLSKRHSAVTLASLRAGGARPEQVVGHLAYLSGLLARPEAVKATDLIPSFRLELVPRGPVTVSPDLLRRLPAL